MLSPTHVNVTVHRAFSLKSKGKAGTNDAYVVIQLGTESYRTSVRERATEPCWNEEYMFPLPMDSRNSDVIRVSVFHRNLLSLDDLLGLTEVPLYKIRNKERARVRRYVLYDKLPTRGSFSKGGRTRRRGTDSGIESQSTEEVSGAITPVTPVTPEMSPTTRQSCEDTGESRPEIELTITLTQEKPKTPHSDLLRPRASSKLDTDDKMVRRKSMPSVFILSSDEISSTSDMKKRNRHSIMSVFEAPRTLLSATLRRSTTASVEDICDINSYNDEPPKDAPKIRDKRKSLDLTNLGQSNAINNANDSKRMSLDLSNLGQNNATNNVRPRDIGFIKESPCTSPPTTPTSSWRSESIVTSPDNVMTPDSQVSSTEQEGDEKDEVLARYQKERKMFVRAARKLPGFMTINSQEKINRYQPTLEELNLFDGYNREDLISTVIRQHARLSLAETYIGDLEHCINNLVMRAMDSQPKLLQNPYMRQSSESATSSIKRPAFLKNTKKALKNKLNKNKSA